MRPAPTACASCGGTALARRYTLRAFDVHECATCGLRFRHPLPTDAELVAMYEADELHASAYYQDRRVAGGPALLEERLFRRGLADLDAMVAPPRDRSPRRLLDVGFGAGVFLDLARAAGWHVTGIDLSERHVASVRARLDLDVRQGDFLATPFPPGSFDAITMWDFLEHVNDPRAVLRAAFDLLAPRGVLLVFTIDIGSLFNVVGDVLHRVSGGRAGGILELLYDARHNYYFTQRALARLVADAGFTIERWHGDRAHLSRWLHVATPWPIRVGGDVVDLASIVVGRPYRRTALCRKP